MDDNNLNNTSNNDITDIADNTNSTENTGSENVSDNSTGNYENNYAGNYNSGYSNNNSSDNNNNSYNNSYTGNNSYNSYNSNGYNNNGYNNNSYTGNNGFNQPPKKKGDSAKKKIAIVSCIVAGVIFLVGSVTFYKEFSSYIDRYTKQNGTNEIAWDKDNTQNDNAENDATATTAPVSVSTAGSNVGAVTDVSGIVEVVMPSVVSITSTSSVEGYSIFGQRYEQQISSAGTGFIVGENDDELLFATNNHVVEDATAIQVTFCDEQTAEAIVKGTDAQADLAVVAVSKKDIKNETKEAIKVALLGDSDKVKVGQIAIAIGNAQGMGQSVTVGYISAKDRKLDMGEGTEQDSSKSMSFLQTDAAINGGNSGGPLIDINGNVVGINSAKISDTSVEGMCYAIPISTAIPIINELMNRETLTDAERGYLGVSLQDISAEAVEMYNVPDGVYVATTSPNGPAEKAGIKEGDIITEINGVSVNTKSAASDKINSYRAGTELEIVVYRQSSAGNGYEAVNIKATLGTAKEAGIEIKSDSEQQNGNSSDNNNGQGQYPDEYYNNEMDDWFNGMFPW